MTGNFYNSDYYSKILFTERFGNVVLYSNEEQFFYIDKYAIPWIETHRYAISNRFRIIDYWSSKYIPISYNTTYPTVNLHNPIKNKAETVLIHRLYMMVFCYFPGCEDYDVNHIDGDKNNFHPSNLEWVTHKENMYHAFKYNIMDRDLKLSDDDIVGIITMYNDNATIKDIALKYKISTGYVADIVIGNKKNRTESIRLSKIKENHPITRKPKTTRFTNIIDDICKLYQDNSDKPFGDLYKLAISEFNLSDDGDTRKVLRNIYNRKTNTKISSKYIW